MVVVISSREMGQGDPALGTLLMKGFIYALTQQDVLPETILLYNGGAFLSCEGSDNLEDLKTLEAQGVEILTCGTCLNHYGIGDRLRVGSVTNMYEIAEAADHSKRRRGYCHRNHPPPSSVRLSGAGAGNRQSFCHPQAGGIFRSNL